MRAGLSFFLWDYASLLHFTCFPLLGQSNRGELLLKVTDPAGRAVKVNVDITSEANQYRSSLATNDKGELDVRRLPFGIYELKIDQPGLATVSEIVEIHSLIDPDQAGSISEIGPEILQNRLASLPGRSLQDLVNSQPGWLYEGNAVLHPRGSEYQTQFVVDGIPLIDNRSPSFGPEIESDDVESMSIYTAGFPAEYGRKMGGVVEVNTVQNSQAGLHGEAVLSGGSFTTAGAFAKGQYGWGKNVLGASASGNMTSHYLNPVVPQNYTNTGTVGNFSINYERDLSVNDRIRFIVRHSLAHYDIPNENVQQAAGQLQTASNLETMGIVSYQHSFAPTFVANFRGMVRENANTFTSNENSTPIEIYQHNWFHEVYFKALGTLNRGHHEWKFGVESDNLFLNENFRYIITDPSQFEPGTAPTFSFQGKRPDLEQSAFVQDLIHFKNWTINAGLRWDHYQLLLNRQAFDPRISLSRYFPSANLVVHFSYDRVFQTPNFENILLSSSTAVESISPTFLRLPVQPSEGNYYEAGLTTVLLETFRLSANYFRRLVSNFSDDNQIQNTAISFPIAFRNSIIYGAEAKLDLPDWRNFSGFVSYSYTVGNGWFPVTGGLFLGSDASAASQLTGHFADTQDQRNTVRSRLRYQVTPRIWIAGGIQYDSGLPFTFTGDPATALAQYGPEVLSRINFARGRIYPSFLANASAGADIYKFDRVTVRLQADAQNLTNVLNVIDFGGLFSGNAIGPSRSFALRLSTSF